MPNPRQPPAWLAALPGLFAAGAALGGAPQVGTGAIAGAERANALAEDQRQRQVMEGQRQQQIDLQTQAAMAQEQARAAQMEERKQAAIRSAYDDLKVQKFKNKAEYDQAVTFRENLLGQAYGMRPNTLRIMVPYNGPNFESDAADAVNALIKQHGVDVLTSGALVSIDRDGDGINENVPIAEAAKVGKVPIAMGPDGKPFVAPKTVAPDKLDKFEKALAIETEKFATEKGRQPQTPDEKRLVFSAAERLAQSPPDPTLDAMRQLALAQLRQNATTKMYSPGQERAVNMLADDYARDSKDFAQRAQSYDTVRGAAKDPTAAGDLSLIFAYMKMLDPGSVVREGEFATAQNATGVPDRIRNLYNQVTQGVRLNPNQRNDFLKQAGNIYNTAKERQDRITATYTQRAKRRGLDPNDVIVDYGAAQAPAAAQSFSVKAPNGKTYTFQSQEQLDAFKAASGIK
jgi:hypothetical protein